MTSGNGAGFSGYDAVVIGAGPAGISAAISIANRKKKVLVLDGRRPFAKARRAPSIPNYPGFQFASGEELAAAFQDHLSRFDVPVVREKVSKIVRDGDVLNVFTEAEVYRTRTVILATGVHREVGIEGEEDLVGQGVSYCANCDGRLFSGREVAYISYAPEGEEEVALLAEDFGVSVTYLTQYARSEQETVLEESPALKPEDREALGRILKERMRDPVRLLHFTQNTEGNPEEGLACDSCVEARRLLQELADLSPLLSLQLLDLVGSSEEAKAAGVERIPATLVGGMGEESPRVRILGLPSGYEFGVLLDAILGASAGGDGATPETLDHLLKLKKRVHIEVLVTSTCPYCPAVGKMAHRFARASEKVTADVVVISEFPDLAQLYQVKRVPRIVLNGVPQVEGAADEETLLSMVLAAAEL